MRGLWRWMRTILSRVWRWWRNWKSLSRRRRDRQMLADKPRRHPIQPKPNWVRQEVIRLKALMPHAGCRTIAHHFNRRWKSRRQMTVSKTYVAETCRAHQYLIEVARRQLKHRVPRPTRPNRVLGCDLLTKADQSGTQHLALAIVDYGSRACLRLRRLSDKSSLPLVRELIEAMKRYGVPTYVRTDNEAVFVSRLFRLGLWLLGIRHQRIEPGCPWQNGRVKRFIGTVKRELASAPIADGNALVTALQDIRQWYNHDRPHDHLHGRTPAEVWAGIDVFAVKPG